MQFIHSRHYMKRGDVVVVRCSHQCNVKLTDDNNFHRYELGRSHNYYGGHFREFPARVAVPDEGHWNITIDLGGAAAKIKHSIEVISPTAGTIPLKR